MTDKIAIYRFENQNGFCSVVAWRKIEVIEVVGNCDLTGSEMDDLVVAIKNSPNDVRQFNRFVFMFPNVPSDVAYRLAGLLEHRIFKASFVVHNSLHGRLQDRIFWEVCGHPQVAIAHLQALEQSGKFDVSTMERDRPADYSFLSPGAVDGAAVDEKL